MKASKDYTVSIYAYLIPSCHGIRVSPKALTYPTSPLLHVRTSTAWLRVHWHALDALLAWVVGTSLDTCIGRAGVRSDGCLAGTLAVGVAGCVVCAETMLLRVLLAAGIVCGRGREWLRTLCLLLLELLAGTCAAAVEGRCQSVFNR